MRIAREKRAPRRLVRAPEIPCFTRLRYLPRDAYYCGGELVPVFDDKERVNPALKGRVCADGIVPYPPGIPMLMSGENFGAADSPQIEYLKSMQNREKQFPGFAGVIEGAEMIDGTYHVLCVKR